MGGIEQLIEKLAILVAGIVDLRYSNGIWLVMVARGNTMACVLGTVSHDPIESLLTVIERWNDRSPEKPFI